MRLSFTIDGPGLDELTALGNRLVYGGRRPPIEARDFKIVGGDAGKIKCMDFTISDRLSPVRGWPIRIRPYIPKMPEPTHLALVFGAGKVGSNNILLRWMDGPIRKLTKAVPRLSWSKGSLIVNLHPFKVRRAECQEDILTIEVTT